MLCPLDFSFPLFAEFFEAYLICQGFPELFRNLVASPWTVFLVFYSDLKFVFAEWSRFEIYLFEMDISVGII